MLTKEQRMKILEVVKNLHKKNSQATQKQKSNNADQNKSKECR
jgi:hypothetical protein